MSKTQYSRHEIAMFYREAADKKVAVDMLAELTGHPGMVIMEILRFEGEVSSDEIEPIGGMDRYDQVKYLWQKGWLNDSIVNYLGCDMDLVFYVKRCERKTANG